MHINLDGRMATLTREGSSAPCLGLTSLGSTGCLSFLLFCLADRLLAPSFGHFLCVTSGGSAMTSHGGCGGGAGRTPRVTTRPAWWWGGKEQAWPTRGGLHRAGVQPRAWEPAVQGPQVSVSGQEEGLIALPYMGDECAPTLQRGAE